MNQLFSYLVSCEGMSRGRGAGRGGTARSIPRRTGTLHVNNESVQRSPLRTPRVKCQYQSDAMWHVAQHVSFYSHSPDIMVPFEEKYLYYSLARSNYGFYITHLEESMH